MKKVMTICAAALAFAVIAADTDCGALITTGNIADSAKVENLTGANAGKATITINDNSGTAKSVTVYNASTMDTALAGKASTGDVSALETRATALETATNNLTTAVENINGIFEVDESGAKIKTDGYKVRWGTSGYIEFNNGGFKFYHPGEHGQSGSDYTLEFPFKGGIAATLADIPSSWPYTAVTNAPWLTSYTETDPNVPSWAKASTKPSYNFSEISSKPTTLSGYGITDASTTSQMNTAIANATNAITAASIGALTSESDPVWTADKSSYSTTSQMNTAIQNATNGLAKASALSGYVPTSRKVAGKALSSDVTLSNLSIVGSTTTTYNGSATASVNQTTSTLTSTTQGGTTGKNLTLAVAATSLDMGAYYIKIGSDGKPHLMLRQ